MSGYPYERRPRPERGPRRGRLALRIALGVLVLAAVFVLGVALGQALHEDGPQRARTQTLLRTLEPLPQRPASSR